ncbi:lysR substrate binding domain protein (plasmid) [Ochrobactrum quorumnocens]|uniref:LysR substrate binding domain protein n=1 Tax=Ochrobactrum quorumnocens TaxID=271865 RepID=A0A248UP26_9HYPH|nr:LysR substrate-binding domain-containing protein [[Ochrobactrum] quorumnocens]ASV88300.1 lysR substrate binding domain protein [[Ochrobactrum] quorumnocens]
MRNIPTDLLRTFVAIIDLRGYGRAGEQLGRTQPAISLQMKRLQELLGIALFSKEGGAQLTEYGEMVASYARQILTLNDEMMLKLSKRENIGRLRLGIPNDYADHFLPQLMEGRSDKTANMTFDITCDLSYNLLRGLRAGLLDIVVAMTADGPAEGAFMTWKERLSWVEAKLDLPVKPHSDNNGDLRIVCYPEGCLYRRSMLTALQREGQSFEIVYTSPSLTGITAALTGGFGITALADRIMPQSLRPIRNNQHLPKLSDAIVGIYVSSDKNRSYIAQNFAATLADLFVNRH